MDQTRKLFLTNDVISYIQSEFLYVEDFFKMFLSSKLFHVHPYQFNFKNGTILKQYLAPLWKLADLGYLKCEWVESGQRVIGSTCCLGHLNHGSKLIESKYNPLFKETTVEWRRNFRDLKVLNFIIPETAIPFPSIPYETIRVDTLSIHNNVDHNLIKKIKNVNHVCFNSDNFPMKEYEIPKTVKCVRIVCETFDAIRFDHSSSIEHLEIQSCGNDSVTFDNFPTKLKYIDIKHFKNIVFPTKIPSSLKYVSLSHVSGHSFPIVSDNSIESIKIKSKSKYLFKSYWKPKASIKHCSVASWRHLKEIIWESAKSLIELPDSINYIKFGNSFNKLIKCKLPKSLKYIEFGHLFDCILPDFSSTNLKFIVFGKYYNQFLPNNLPQSIQYIQFGESYNRELPDSLPKSLKAIYFGENYQKKLPENLPDSIEFISFGSTYYNKKLPQKLPKELKLISCNEFLENQKLNSCGYFIEEVDGKKFLKKSEMDHNCKHETCVEIRQYPQNIFNNEDMKNPLKNKFHRNGSVIVKKKYTMMEKERKKLLARFSKREGHLN